MALIFVVSALYFFAATVAGAAVPQPHSEDPTVQADAAQWYATNFHVSVDTANQRLAIQDAGNAVLGDASSQLGAAYAGAWFDATDGGRLKIAVAGSLTSQSVQAAQRLLGSVAGNTDFIAAKFSLALLRDAQTVINARLAGLLAQGKVTTSVDFAGNTVEIDIATTLTSDDQAVVNATASDALTPARVVQTNQADLTSHGSSCGFPSNYLMCDPPLRGGAGIVAANSTLCSQGLLVFSNSNGAPYILTAGHCAYAAGGSVWSAWFASGASHQVGYTHSYTLDSTGDYAIIGIENPSGWQVSGNRYVWVGPSAAGITTQNSFYPISGDGYPASGSVLCATGTVSPNGYYTNCGSVDAGYHTTNECDNGHCVTVNNLFFAHYAATQGDSGGSVYKNNVLYGTTVSFNSSGVYFEPSPIAFAGAGVH